MGIILLKLTMPLWYSFLLYPVFAVLLFLYYYRASGKFSIALLGFLIATMVSEILFQHDFQSNVHIVSFSMLVACVLMVYLVKPILRFEFKNFARHSIAEISIGVLSITFIVGYLSYVILPSISDLTFFVPSFVVLLATSAVFFAIPLFNRHPANVYLTGVAGALLTEMIFAFLNEFMLQLDFFMVASIFFGVF